MSKFFKVIMVALVLFVNLAVAQPSLAGKDFTKGADYAEVTQELNQLLSAQSDPSTAGYTPEQYQQRLSELQMQKYVIETAKKRAQCRMQPGKRWQFMLISRKTCRRNFISWQPVRLQMMIGIAMVFTCQQGLKLL